jgi:hypothetical protein
MINVKLEAEPRLKAKIELNKKHSAIKQKRDSTHSIAVSAFSNA